MRLIAFYVMKIVLKNKGENWFKEYASFAIFLRLLPR